MTAEGTNEKLHQQQQQQQQYPLYPPDDVYPPKNLGHVTRISHDDHSRPLLPRTHLSADAYFAQGVHLVVCLQLQPATMPRQLEVTTAAVGTVAAKASVTEDDIPHVVAKAVEVLLLLGRGLSPKLIAWRF